MSYCQGRGSRDAFCSKSETKGPKITRNALTLSPGAHTQAAVGTALLQNSLTPHLVVHTQANLPHEQGS